MAKIYKVPVPKTRDPFVNAPLLALGKGKDGLERFWISTWNSVSGTTGVVVDENGGHRIYRFGKKHSGFYSACLTDPATLWLCGFLNKFVCLDLVTGKFSEYSVDIRGALVFAGMIYDPQTKKLFALAYPPPNTAAVSFDTKKRKVCKIYHKPSTAINSRVSFANDDGTYSMVVRVPNEELVTWDPVNETVDTTSLVVDTIDVHSHKGRYTDRLITDENHQAYFPEQGWYSHKKETFIKAKPEPEKEMTWFGRYKSTAFGALRFPEYVKIHSWNTKNGSVNEVCIVPDASQFNVNVTQSGKIIAVNMYGNFYRYNGFTGELELSRSLPTDRIGCVDCVCRIDKRRLLGTPFITQRFWEADLITGKGYDCGKAAPGSGEILQTWNINKKIYMAAYTGGELTEYDTDKHPHFPENPRLVAKPVHGMRPVAACDDGRHIYYSCSRPYGTLGSVITKYDTKTGSTCYSYDPLKNLQIRSLCYDKHFKKLICGTSIYADCQSCPPKARSAALARINPDDLSVEKRVTASRNMNVVDIIGPLGKGRYLCMHERKWSDVSIDDLVMPSQKEWNPLPDDLFAIKYAGKTGHFCIWHGCSVELWDLQSNRLVKVLCDSFKGYRISVQGGSLYLFYPKEIIILENQLHESG